MLGITSTDLYLTGAFIGFAAGFVVAVLLLVLTLRASKIPGTPAGNILFALCALAWNLGGLVQIVAVGLGSGEEARPAHVGLALQFTAVAVWPISILAIWRSPLEHPAQMAALRALEYIAAISGATFVILLWSAAAFEIAWVPLGTTKQFTVYSGSALLAAGALLMLRGRVASRAASLSSMTTLAGVLVGVLTVLLHNVLPSSDGWGAAVQVVGQQSVLLVVLGAFFLFSRFRFADLFIEYSLRLVLASLMAVVLVFLIDAMFVSWPLHPGVLPRAALGAAASVLATVALLGFALIDRHVGAAVGRWVLRAPDYRDAGRRLGEALRVAEDEATMRVAATHTARRTLELADVRVIDVAALPHHAWPAAIHDGQVVEVGRVEPLRARLPVPDVELLVPVSVGGTVGALLAVSPGLARRGLVVHEVDYLRTVAGQLGARLDAWRREREMASRQNREAVLRQQVTDAELRALRAQVNPHFLFNSLNTIANLIVTNPDRAETMTLRLARVFHHVLARSATPMTSIRDEIDFVRTYLEIEEARFGDRLLVDIDISPDVAQEPIPSLILQPLVENALKHGLAPKPGAGHLWIAACAEGAQVRLTVEDDGIGTRPHALTNANGRPSSGQTSEASPSTGVGLANIGQRLNTVYQDRARMTVESRDAGGTRVTLLVPRTAGGGS